MAQTASLSSPHAGSRRLSNRILILALSGIFFLTLYPFRLNLNAKVSGNWSPFLLDISHKEATFSDAFLNILLFVPFGLGLSGFLRRRNWSLPAILSAALLSGALCSYAIEFLQIYIPGRDSGWEDVFTNSSGSVVGFILFAAFGKKLLPPLRHAEQAVESWLSVPRVLIIVSVYFALWLGLSLVLQRETRLTSWDPSCSILIGDDAAGKSAWKGRVSLLQFWDRPYSPDHATRPQAAGSNSIGEAGLVASYDLAAGPPPFQDKQGNLPPLVPLVVPVLLDSGASNPQVESPSPFTRLTTSAPVTGLVQKLQNTNQFSVRLDFTPEGEDEGEGDIFSVSNSHGVNDLLVFQDGTEITIYIRTGLFSHRPRLVWEFSDLITPDRPTSIFISYDGSRATLYVNGKKMRSTFNLGPGAALARKFVRIHTAELLACFIIYNALIFAPIGILLGFAKRKLATRSFATWAAFAMIVLIPPALMEFFLVYTSGRAPSSSLIILGACLTVAGFLWINADHPDPTPASSISTS